MEQQNIYIYCILNFIPCTLILCTYNKLTNALFRLFISPFYCSYMFRRTHVTIREIFCRMLNYTKTFMRDYGVC
jgi:hypothetical protein